MITFPLTILKAEWTAVSDWIYIFHLLNSCFCSCCLSNCVRTNQTHYFLSRKTKTKLLTTFRYSIWDQSYIYTLALCGFKHFEDSVSWKVSPLFQPWEFQFVLKSEGIRHLQPLQHLSQHRNALNIGHRGLSLHSHCHCWRWVDEGVKVSGGVDLFSVSCPCRRQTWYNRERKVT